MTDAQHIHATLDRIEAEHEQRMTEATRLLASGMVPPNPPVVVVARRRRWWRFWRR